MLYVKHDVIYEWVLTVIFQSKMKIPEKRPDLNLPVCHRWRHWFSTTRQQRRSRWRHKNRFRFSTQYFCQTIFWSKKRKVNLLSIKARKRLTKVIWKNISMLNLGLKRWDKGLREVGSMILWQQYQGLSNKSMTIGGCQKMFKIVWRHLRTTSNALYDM